LSDGRRKTSSWVQKTAYECKNMKKKKGNGHQFSRLGEKKKTEKRPHNQKMSGVGGKVEKNSSMKTGSGAPNAAGGSKKGKGGTFDEVKKDKYVSKKF